MRQRKRWGFSITTLRPWEATGKLATIHTAGGHWRYDLIKLKPELFHAASQTERSTIAYARVSPQKRGCRPRERLPPQNRKPANTELRISEGERRLHIQLPAKQLYATISTDSRGNTWAT